MSLSILLRYESGLVVVLDWFFFFQAEDGIRDLVRSRGLGDVYKRQAFKEARAVSQERIDKVLAVKGKRTIRDFHRNIGQICCCLLYTSDAADERSSVDLGGRRIIKKKTHNDRVEISVESVKSKKTRTQKKKLTQDWMRLR